MRSRRDGRQAYVRAPLPDGGRRQRGRRGPCNAARVRRERRRHPPQSCRADQHGSGALLCSDVWHSRSPVRFSPAACWLDPQTRRTRRRWRWSPTPRPTSGPSPGAASEKAATELPNYNIEMYVVSEATAAEQRRILDDLLTKGIAGVSISSIDPANSTDILNKVASQAVLFTTDSDAPKSERVLYIGTDNTAGGRAGGRADQEGAAGRRQDHDVRRHHGGRQCPRARRRHQEGARGQQGRDHRHPHRRGRLRPRQAQRRGHADQVSRHRRAGRPLLLQHAADRRGRARLWPARATSR